MAIGNKNKNYDNKNAHFVNVVTKDAEDKDIKPYFSFRKKTGDKEYTEVAKDTSFSGTLAKVLTHEREYQGVKSPRVKIIFEDGDDSYILDMSYTILSRSLFNSLLSLESMEELILQIYQTKPNDKGKVYPQMSLRQGEKGVMIRWKYTREELPEIKKVKIKGKEMSDTEDVDNFFRDKLIEKFDSGASHSAPSAPAASTKADTTKATKANKSTKAELDEETLPF